MTEFIYKLCHPYVVRTLCPDINKYVAFPLTDVIDWLLWKHILLFRIRVSLGSQKAYTTIPTGSLGHTGYSFEASRTDNAAITQLRPAMACNLNERVFRMQFRWKSRYSVHIAKNYPVLCVKCLQDKRINCNPGCSLIGKRAEVKRLAQNWQPRITAIPIIYADGSINGENFEGFVTEKLCPNLLLFNVINSRCVIIMGTWP